MTLIYKLDLKILKVYCHTKSELLGQDFQKLEHYRQTHGQMRLNALPHRRTCKTLL